jgi:hypothetical protein
MKTRREIKEIQNQVKESVGDIAKSNTISSQKNSTMKALTAHERNINTRVK